MSFLLFLKGIISWYTSTYLHLCYYWAVYYTALIVCVRYLQSWTNFSITFQNYHVLQNNHLVGLGQVENLPLQHHWDNNASVTSNLLTKRICQLCSQQWYRLYQKYLWLLKWQRQEFLLTCSMSSYDKFTCKDVFTLYVGLCYCIIWPSFLSDCLIKMRETCENFWQMVHFPLWQKVAYTPMPRWALPILVIYILLLTKI